MRGGCLSGCSSCATIWAFCQRNTTWERKRLVGNFPQAFSHISLVNAAFDLEDGPHVRSRAHRNGHKK
jgi:hypothetical protein